MNTSYARTKFKFYHRRLIRSYNVTMGHQLLGLVRTVDSSTFHWSLNSPRVVRKGLWFIVDLIKSRWRAFSWRKKGKITLDSRVGSKHTRQRQTGRGREKVWTKYWCGQWQRNSPPLFTCHYPKSKSMVLEFLHIFFILILSILLSQWLITLSNQEAPTRDSSGGVREKLKYCKKCQKWLLKQARKCMCHCVGHLLRWPITSARGHGWTELSGLNLSIKNTFRHILLVGIILIAVRNPNIWEKNKSFYLHTYLDDGVTRIFWLAALPLKHSFIIICNNKFRNVLLNVAQHQVNSIKDKLDIK